MAPTLKDIRAKLAQQETRTSGNNNSVKDNAIYPFWDIPENSTARLRFLPDGNEKNDFAWVERAMIRLPFSGVKGQINSKPVIVQVPCMEMYGANEVCPVLAEVRPWYKDPSLKEMANKYWKKRSYLFQGFVRENPLTNDTQPENPIRRFVVSPQIYPLIISAYKDPEIEELPTDFDRGLDFSITKTTKGEYADYATSKWARKESALTQAERNAIDTFGLYNLNDFLPKKPTEIELKIIKEMFEASVDGETYDEARWGQFYKPYGLNGSTESDEKTSSARSSSVSVSSKAPEVVTAPWDDESTTVADTPVVAATKTDSNSRATEILAQIRNRKTA